VGYLGETRRIYRAYNETPIKEIAMTKVQTLIALENALRDSVTYFDMIKAGFELQVFKQENKFAPKTIKA
jgi:hypothetical protein